MQWFSETASDPDRQVIAEMAYAMSEGDCCGTCGSTLPYFETNRPLNAAFSVANADRFSRWRCGTAELDKDERGRLLALLGVTEMEVRRMVSQVRRGSDPTELVRRWRYRREAVQKTRTRWDAWTRGTAGWQRGR